MSNELKPVVAIHITDEDKFSERCNELIKQGYEMQSSYCGFVNSAEYDFCTSHHAIFLLNTRTSLKEELIEKIKGVVEPCCEAAVIEAIEEVLK